MDDQEKRDIRALTVKELRQRLFEVHDQDSLVVLAYDYGDYCRTTAVVGVLYVSQEVHLKATGYSPSGYGVDDQQFDPDHIYETPVAMATVLSAGVL